jgi:hypothetical protein
MADEELAKANAKAKLVAELEEPPCYLCQTRAHSEAHYHGLSPAPSALMAGARVQPDSRAGESDGRAGGCGGCIAAARGGTCPPEVYYMYSLTEVYYMYSLNLT